MKLIHQMLRKKFSPSCFRSGISHASYCACCPGILYFSDWVFKERFVFKEAMWYKLLSMHHTKGKNFTREQRVMDVASFQFCYSLVIRPWATYIIVLCPFSHRWNGDNSNIYLMKSLSLNEYILVCVYVNSLQLHPTLCDTVDCSLPGSSVQGILQARILEWVAMPSSRGSSQPRDWLVSLMSLALQADFLPLSHQGSLNRYM